MTSIDPTARVDKDAQIGRNVTIGPYCVVGPKAVIGDDCKLLTHVVVAGRTTIGARTSVSAFSSLGTAPQSVHYHGEDTALTIGTDCDIREHVTMNIGTAEGKGGTKVGNHCFLMVGAHVAHDCVVGDHVNFANNATLGGFCQIGSYVFLGGLCAVHQFVRVGESAIVGGLVGVTFDVIPYAAVIGHRGKLAGLNRVGLKRRDFSGDEIRAIYRAYRQIFFGEGTLAERVEKVAAAHPDEPHVMQLVDFIRAGKARRFMTPRDAVDENE